MTVTGNVAPAPPAGSTVAVTFDGSGTPGTIDDRVVTVNATTDASGNWSASLQVVRGDQGTWSVSSAYAGSDQYAASQSAACSVARRGQLTHGMRRETTMPKAVSRSLAVAVAMSLLILLAGAGRSGTGGGAVDEEGERDVAAADARQPDAEPAAPGGVRELEVAPAARSATRAVRGVEDPVHRRQAAHLVSQDAQGGEDPRLRDEAAATARGCASASRRSGRHR